jgi:DNA processing protein
LALWVVGQAAQSPSLASLTSKCVAVVGSRAATHYGEVVTGSITEHLVAAGLTVLSGGAFGIDAAAHRAAVSLDGQSVAVMAGGVDRFYPVANTTLLEQVAASGAVIAEVPPGSAPRRERFLLRNRLIAALAGASIVVEAGWRSGAQSTARLAAELLRPVGAVPGPITSAASAGCHRLIREGVATCVTDGAEVVELLQPCDASDAEMMHDDGLPGLLDDLPPDQARLLDCLPKHGSARLTALVRAAGVPERSVLVALGGLEGRGLVHREVGAWRRACQTKAA